MTNEDEQKIKDWGITQNREQRNKQEVIDLGIEWLNI
jgi:hypothetical protein